MNEKTKQILAYIFGPIAGLVFFLLKDSSRDTKYHAAQSLTIGVLGLLLTFVPIIRYFAGLAVLVFVIWGIVKVVNEEDPKLPGVSNIVDAIFAKEFGESEKTNTTTKEVDAEIKDAEPKDKE